MFFANKCRPWLVCRSTETCCQDEISIKHMTFEAIRVWQMNITQKYTKKVVQGSIKDVISTITKNSKSTTCTLESMPTDRRSRKNQGWRRWTYLNVRKDGRGIQRRLRLCWATRDARKLRELRKFVSSQSKIFPPFIFGHAVIRPSVRFGTASIQLLAVFGHVVEDR